MHVLTLIGCVLFSDVGLRETRGGEEARVEEEEVGGRRAGGGDAER